MPVSDDRYETYLVVALFLYALPFVHNLLCVEIPFNAGYDLALRYLSVPAAAVVVFGNALLPPQQSVTYDGVVVGKFTSGRFGETHVARVRITSPHSAVIRFRVAAGDYARLMVGDAFSKKMVLGPLDIPYVDHCGWLARASQPNRRLERAGMSPGADIRPSRAGRSAAIR